MRHDKFSKQNILLYCLGTIPVIWLALLIAPFMEDGLPGLIKNFGAAMSRPFYITLCGNSLKTILVLLLCYGLAIGIYLSTQRNYRRREEHGSAQWGSPVQVNRKYADKVPTRNKILTQNVSVGLDGRKHRRNLNTLVCGGSGAGKTRFFAKPNLCQANSSYVVLDPKGELLRDTGNLLSSKGYDIKVLDLINMEKSHCYNPFVYLRSDNDIQRLVTNLFKNTTPKGSQSQDPFWDQAATMLLLALIFYLHYEAPPEEQNFPMVMEMIRAGEVREDDETYKSALDILFERLEMRNPEHIALKYYRSYHSGSGKTLKSIQITLISRLEKFNLESLASITQNDELELWSIGEKKTAVFAIIPDNDSSFSFLVGMLYTQLFQQLYYQADVIHGGRLPVHVHFLMDEFANVALPDEFDKLLSTMRSREISVSIIIQNTTGSLDIFGHVGNVDLDKRVVVFNIHDLGEQLKPAGLLVITDTMLNRVTLNWQRGRRTHVFIDEFHVVFENEQSGNFFASAWRQFRKRNAFPTAITQNVEYLLDSVQASTMVSNSEFVVMLNQAAKDREKLAKLLNISNEQMSYVTNADAGCGLIRYGRALVPFINRFPKNTELYKLMTTRPGEGVFGVGRDG